MNCVAVSSNDCLWPSKWGCIFVVLRSMAAPRIRVMRVREAKDFLVRETAEQVRLQRMRSVWPLGTFRVIQV